MGRAQTPNEKEILVSSQSAIEHILTHKPERISRLQISKSKNPRLDKLRDLARSAGLHVDTSGNEVSEPARAWLSPFEYTDIQTVIENCASKKRALILLLDHLQDPQNFGALCRSAEALGADAIFVPKDRGVIVTAGVYNSSVGAVETLPVCRVTNLGEAARRLKEAGFWIVGTSLEGGAKPPESLPDFEKIGLFLGAEYEGLSPSLVKQCDWLIEIPLKGLVQSLNVSVAGGILCYLFSRGQKSK